jgi:hypothetical protein
MSVTVIYIARGIGAGLDSVKQFFSHYENYVPGCPHRLIVVTKGWDGVFGLSEVHRLAGRFTAEIIELPDDGLDWGAYIRIAPTLQDEWVCMLNSFSQPVVKNWLDLLRFGAIEAGVGVVGATGSWESNLTSGIYSPWNFKTLAQYPIRLAYGYYRYLSKKNIFPSYPNPHLRSNALFLKSELFKNFCKARSIPSTKEEALTLECGVKSLTNYVILMGLDVRVVGADGRSFCPQEWGGSKTFRTPGQPNLLIHDNRTRLYDSSDRFLKRAIERATWGSSFTP